MNRRHVLTTTAGALSAAAATTFTAPAAARRPAMSAVAPATRPFIRTRDGESLFYLECGAGAPVVFVSAWALPAAMWDAQTVAIADAGFRCVAFDRRGHGRSSPAPRGYDFDTLADDLAALLEALDLRGVTLVGMSMGAGEIVRYLTRHGSGRVSRIALVGTAATPFRMRTGDNPGDIPPEMFEPFRQVLLRDFPQWIEENRAPFFLPDTPRPVQEWVRGLMLQHSRLAIADCARMMGQTDFRAELRKIRVPALVIHGDRDASAPIDVTGRPTAAAIPGARLVVYEGGPHGLFVTHRDRLTADLLAFARG